jgi:hypothetical protein
MALNDASVRTWVKAEMDKSPYVEQRIRFKQSLAGAASKPHIQRILAESRLGSTASSDIKSLRDLELYMPIPEQLNAWRGEAPVQVAVPISRDEEYIIYSPDGHSARSRGDYIPAIPTLVLGPSEIEYDDLESALMGGRRTGPAMTANVPMSANLPVSRGTPLKAGLSFGISTAQHTRLAMFMTTENHDGVFAGNDEVEVFGAMGTWFHVGGTHRGCTRYTNVDKGQTHYLPNLPVSTVAAAVPTGSDRVYLHAYEDDFDACLHDVDDDFYGKLSLVIEQYPSFWRTIRDSGAPGHIWLGVRASTP